MVPHIRIGFGLGAPDPVPPPGKENFMINQSAHLKTGHGDLRRLGLLGIGYVSFAAGLVGMFLPVLPTTVFWIIAAICFAKSSPTMYRRILAWPRIGEPIGDFIDHGVIRGRSKYIALAGMTIGAALILIARMGSGISVLALAGIAFAALYVITRPGR